MLKATGATSWSENHYLEEKRMEKSLFEQLGGTYHEENGYRIPELALKTA